jgi:hypothetical protein
VRWHLGLYEPSSRPLEMNMSKAEVRAQIADIERQLVTIDASKRFWSWQRAYLPILEKRLREHF